MTKIKSERIRAVLIFLTFVIIGPLVGCIILGLAGSTFLAPMIDPQRIMDGTMLIYIFIMAFSFGAIPAFVSGVIMALKYLRSGYFRARYAIFAAFVSSGLVGPAYHLYAGNQPTGQKLINSILMAYVALGPVAAICGFLSQRAARTLRLIEAPEMSRDAGLDT